MQLNNGAEEISIIASERLKREGRTDEGVHAHLGRNKCYRVRAFEANLGCMAERAEAACFKIIDRVRAFETLALFILVIAPTVLVETQWALSHWSY